jgi:hypothetical protein
MTMSGVTASASWTAMSRQAVRRAVVAAVLVGLCVVGVNLLERLLGLTFDKPPMPLTKSLTALSANFGSPRQYTMDGTDQFLSEAFLDVLGTKDYLLRTYRDTQKSPGELGQRLSLNLNYYDTGAATPHVPERCWAGNGLVEKGGTRHIFTVPGVRRKDGSVVDVRMTMVSFLPRAADPTSPFAATGDDNRLLNVAYAFQVNGNYVATPKEVLSTFWKAANKHAYHCKIEVSLKDQYCHPEEAEKIIGQFIREAIPEIEECLPDPRRLNDDVTEPAATRSSGA